MTKGTGSYRTYSSPGKTAPLVPEFAVEDLPSAELQPRFLNTATYLQKITHNSPNAIMSRRNIENQMPGTMDKLKHQMVQNDDKNETEVDIMGMFSSKLFDTSPFSSLFTLKESAW